MQFQLAGLASGFDWRTMIDQLMAVERIPQDRLREDKGENSEKLTALNSIGTRLTKLNSTLGTFQSSDLYNAKKISVSNEDLGVTATASTSAVQGTYSINVTQLATTTKRTGTSDVGGDLSGTSTLISELNVDTDIEEGSFTINGQSVSVASTDTLQDVFDAISTATSGVVTASYSAVSDKVTLNSSSGELTLGSDDDDSNFLEAMKLEQLEVVDGGSGEADVTSTDTLGVVDLDDTLSDALSVTGSDTLYINGVAIDFDADSDSVSTFVAAVNSSDANVTMTYDSANDQFRIVNNETGAYSMHVEDSSNGLLAAMGLTGSADVGNDLQFTVDGGSTISSRSNAATSDEHGIEGLTINATETGTQTVTIARDSTQVRDAIDKFIAAYNDIQDFIQERTKIEVEDDEVTAGVLASNREVSALASELRSLAFDAIDGLSGDYIRLEHLGIDFISDTSKLEVKDGSDLDTALAGHLDELETFFYSASDAFAARMEDYIDDYTADDGILDIQKETLTDQNSRIDDQIAEMERRAEFTRRALEASFIAMEEAQSNIQTQSSALAGLLV